MRIPIITVAALLTAVGGVQAQSDSTATAELRRPDGERAGEVLLRQTPGSGTLLTIDLNGLEPGVYAIHIHETGACEPPTFESAGGHFAPERRSHGFLHADGPHAGDLINLRVPASGEVSTERLATFVTLSDGAANSLFDADGSAIVVHAGSDDYASQPSGDAGDRLACGVVMR